jgi:hypothetical protein
VYASTHGVAGLPDAMYWYDAMRHALVQVGPAATGSATTVVVTGVPWRTGWRYAERGWRHLYWDAGTLLSQLSAAAATAGLGPQVRSLFPDVPPSDSLDQVVLRRGSQRLMDRSRTLPRHLLEWPMAAALRGVRVPHWVAVHGVDGVEPGLYRWPDFSTPVRSGQLRGELERICLDQTLAADAAYVVIAASPSSALDDRGYRDAQLAAGLVEGRLRLAAYALDAGASAGVRQLRAG